MFFQYVDKLFSVMTMTKKIGKQTFKLAYPPTIATSAAVVGEKEGSGPLKSYFDYISNDSYFGEKSWEKA